jgi:hypothetical protein
VQWTQLEALAAGEMADMGLRLPQSTQVTGKVSPKEAVAHSMEKACLIPLERDWLISTVTSEVSTIFFQEMCNDDS